jgi:hypothetical protein
MRGFSNRDVIFPQPQPKGLLVMINPHLVDRIPVIDARKKIETTPQAYQAPSVAIHELPEIPGNGSWKGKPASDYIAYAQLVIKPAMATEGLDLHYAPPTAWIKEHEAFKSFYNAIAVSKHLAGEGVSTYSQLMEKAGFMPNKAGRKAKQ